MEETWLEKLIQSLISFRYGYRFPCSGLSSVTTGAWYVLGIIYRIIYYSWSRDPEPNRSKKFRLQSLDSTYGLYQYNRHVSFFCYRLFFYKSLFTSKHLPVRRNHNKTKDALSLSQSHLFSVLCACVTCSVTCWLIHCCQVPASKIRYIREKIPLSTLEVIRLLKMRFCLNFYMWAI